MRIPFVLLLLSVPLVAGACTTFTVTHNGHTFIGCNEDAWSVNANVRFEQGRDGGYGAIYFAHYNGHPMRAMTDQLGMNEAGLVFDGLSIQPKEVRAMTGKKQIHFDELMQRVLRTCATVQEAATLLRTYDGSQLHHSMIFLADKHGAHLIMENDTILEGNDAWYAVGNWRMGDCSDPATIPIPRLQRGRQLLLAGKGASLAEAQEVLGTMTACRDKIGEGTLFSVLFDPTDGLAQLYFYHDMREHVTFDLRQELAKGDRTVAMASLFGTRPEYERLQNYITPFHQRWLFWAMTAWLAITVLLGAVCALWFVRDAIRLVRRRTHGRLAAPLFLGLACVTLTALLATLLLNEAPYYFGLGEVDPLLAWLPALFLALTAGFLLVSTARRWRYLVGAQLATVLSLSAYWGLLF